MGGLWQGLSQIRDGRPTTAEWPVRIWNEWEIPSEFRKQVMEWMQGAFSKSDFIFAPRRRRVEGSFSYLFGYEGERLLYLRKTEMGIQKAQLNRSQIVEVYTQRELLNALLRITYRKEEQQHTLFLPYIPSTYYLYDPFLNWLLGRSKDFLPVEAEQEYPRPMKLYRESLAMYNYSLAAYRLGDGFEDYSYRYEKRRRPWMPWRVFLEEWLEVPMDHGNFELHTFGYLTECTYRIGC